MSKIDLDLHLDSSQLRDEISRAQGIFDKFRASLGAFGQAVNKRQQLNSLASGNPSLKRNIAFRGGHQSLFFHKGGYADRWMGQGAMAGIRGGARWAGSKIPFAGRMGAAAARTPEVKAMKKLVAGLGQLGTEFKGLFKALKRNTQTLQRVGRGTARMGMKAAGGAASFLGGGLVGFMTGGFREAISNYETVGRARAGAANVLGPRARLADGVGASYGYNAAEMAQLQARGGLAGLGVDRAGGKASAILSRSFQGGIEVGGGFMRRQGLAGSSGTKDMYRGLSRAFTLAVKTGLDASRISEFMQEANQLSEKQIAITPDMKGVFKDFTTEMGRLQEFGGAGLRGKYAGQALGRVHGAIQNAQGVQQQFAMRAFGFGRGASLMEVLKRQEQGATGANVSAIMKQLQSEYGAGKDGGLSDAGKLAFKQMGFGSISMSEKFSQAYLQRQNGTITQNDFEKKIQAAKDEEKTKSMPSIQRRAYESMARFGGVVKRFASRFNRMAKEGARMYPILKHLDTMQKEMMGLVRPLFDAIRKAMPVMVDALKSLMPVLKPLVEQIATGVSMISSVLAGFFKGAAGGYGFMGKFSGGVKGAWDALQKINLEEGQKKKKPSVVKMDGDKAAYDAYRRQQSLVGKMSNWLTGGPGVSKATQDAMRKKDEELLQNELVRAGRFGSSTPIPVNINNNIKIDKRDPVGMKKKSVNKVSIRARKNNGSKR
jgi:hypothetical protein